MSDSKLGTMSLRWIDGMGFLVIEGNTFYLQEKPEIRFSYDGLIFEYDDFADFDRDTQTVVDVGFAVVQQDGVERDMTHNERSLCLNYIIEFRNSADVQGIAYDEQGVFRGIMLRSEATEKGYQFKLSGLDAPEYAASKLVGGTTWGRIKAVIRSDGSLALWPESLCDACVEFFTEAEWANHSKPRLWSDRWDFIAEEWKETRTVAGAKESAESILKYYSSSKINQLLGGEDTGSLEKQREAAEEYLTNPGTASTPYLDLLYAAAKQAGATITKTEFAQRLVAKYADDKQNSIALAQGTMYGQVMVIQSLETLDAVDAFMYQYETANDIPHSFVQPYSE